MFISKQKSALVAIVILGVMPFSACSNGEQSGYMQSSTAEQNLREAELAEQEFADLAAQESNGDEVLAPHVRSAKTAKKEITKKDASKKETTKAVAKHDVKAPAKHAAPAKHETDMQAVAKHEMATRTPASKEIAKPFQPAHQSVKGTAAYTVQLGAFKVKENAEKLTAKLKGDGYPVLMRPINHSKNGELFLVQLEPTPNKNEAAKWQSDLKLKSFDSSITFHRD